MPKKRNAPKPLVADDLATLAVSEPAASNDNHTKTIDEIMAWIEASSDFVIRLREYVQRALAKKSMTRATTRVFQEADWARSELGAEALEKAVRIIVIEEGGDDRLIKFALGLVLRDPEFVRIPS